MKFLKFFGINDLKDLTYRKYNQDLLDIRNWWDDHDSGFRSFSNISFGVTTNSKSTSYGASISDQLILMDTTSSAITLTLPSAVGLKGKQYIVMNVGTKNLTIATTSAQTINGGSSYLIPNKYFSVELYSDGSNWVAR